MSDTAAPSTDTAAPAATPDAAAPTEANAAQPEKAAPPEPAEDVEVIKIDGQERKLTRAQLREMAEKAAGADERFRAAAEIHKQNIEIRNQLIELAKAKPLFRRMIEDPNFDEKTWAAEVMSREIERHAMTPEERELADLRAERAERLKAQEAEQMTAAERAEEEQHAARVEHQKQQAQAAILDAIKASGGNLPAEPETVRFMAAEILLAKRQGLPVDNPDYLRQFVKASEPVVLEKMRKYYGVGIEKLSDEQFMATIDPKIVERLNRIQVSKIKGEQQQKPTQSAQPKPRSSRRKYTWDEIYGDT